MPDRVGSFGRQLKASDHKGDEMLPTSEEEVTRQRAEIIEKGAACTQFSTQPLVGSVTQMECGVTEEG